MMDSNPADGMDIVSRVCCEFYRWGGGPLRQADHSLRGVLPFVCVCVIVCDLETSRMSGLGPSWNIASEGKKYIYDLFILISNCEKLNFCGLEKIWV